MPFPPWNREFLGSGMGINRDIAVAKPGNHLVLVIGIERKENQLKIQGFFLCDFIRDIKEFKSQLREQIHGKLEELGDQGGSSLSLSSRIWEYLLSGKHCPYIQDFIPKGGEEIWDWFRII